MPCTDSQTKPSRRRTWLASVMLGGVLPVMLFIFAGVLPDLVRGDDLSPEQKAAKARAEMEPEEVARKFFVALLTKDKAAIERYILPDEHQDVLWEGEPVPEEARTAAHRQVDGMQFQRLKPGDTVTAANGKKYTVEAKQVSDQRVLLLPVGFHFPFAVVRQPDGWRVKATTMIAARMESQEKKK